MRNNRRDFLKISGVAGLGLAGTGILEGFAKGFSPLDPKDSSNSGNPYSFHINDAMKEAYQAALNILKPSKKELEHGLELHRNSVVIDCYGFIPRAAVDGQRIKAAIEDQASPLEIQDLQEDMSMSRFVEHEREREEFLNAWKASGVTCVIQNAGEEGNEVQLLLKRLSRFTYTTD